jgi:transposase
MTLSYSRDPFCCFAASQDPGSLWDCHRRAFAHFGGVPAMIVYDRTKTVVGRHVGRGQATPLNPEAVAFASHYDFAIHQRSTLTVRPASSSSSRAMSASTMSRTSSSNPVCGFQSRSRSALLASPHSSSTSEGR